MALDRESAANRCEGASWSWAVTILFVNSWIDRIEIKFVCHHAMTMNEIQVSGQTTPLGWVSQGTHSKATWPAPHFQLDRMGWCSWMTTRGNASPTTDRPQTEDLEQKASEIEIKELPLSGISSRLKLCQSFSMSSIRLQITIIA